MGVYSIKDLENFTRIKAHTLRIWEQRYNLLNPERTETNIRLYSERDLKKILNINLLYNNGLKISKIAKLSETEIFRLANEILLVGDGDQVNKVDVYINHIIQFDETAIKKELNEMLTNESMETTFSKIIIPVLTKIGELWQVDAINVTHEHFFSNLIRAFIIQNTVRLKIPKNKKAKVLLFLNENEYHEIGILFYHYYLKKRGYDCIYLGQAVPFDDLKLIIEEVKPDYIFTSLIAKMNEKEFIQFFEELSACFNLNRLFVGGYQLGVFETCIPKGVNVIHEINNIDLT